MPGELSTWVAMLLIAAITIGSRMAGSVLMSGVRLTPRVERFLDGLSNSVIAALVASLLAQNGPREAVAVALAIIVMLGSKNAVLAMLAGIAAAALWTFVSTH